MADTTTLVIMRDAAWPSNLEPSTAAELVYAGGDTPNPEIWDLSTARYRVPCWVRSDPVGWTADTEMFLRWLANNRVPQGVVTVLDLETAVDPAYVNGFGAAMHAAGYLVWVYGSKNYVFSNPRLDGYFIADPTGTEHLYPGSVATQYLAAGSYDLSVISPGQPLWDTRAPTIIPPSEVTMFIAVAANTTTTPPTITQGDVYLVTETRKYGLNVAATQQALEQKLGAAVPVDGGLLQQMLGS